MAAAEPRPSVGSQDLTGTIVGRFAVRALLGSGGMGEVYRADDTRLKRPVALKRVSRKLGADPRARERILKEAERASALNSPHIAAVYDVMEHDGEVFLVMEYVEGVSLRQHLRTHGRLPLAEFLDLAVQCAEALATAHKKGIVHRDIKPDNIMITPAGQAKILDFGLARRLPVPDDAENTIESQSRYAMAGTPGYIAPEILLGAEGDDRADVFSLGVVFYEMLAGQHPFRLDPGAKPDSRTLDDPVARLRELVPWVPADLQRILGKMLSKAVEARYATSADLLVDLRALRPGKPRPFVIFTAPAGRRWGRRIGRGLVIALLVLLALAIWPPVHQQWKRWFGLAELPEKKNLAVLPFHAVDGDPGAHAFAQGLTETLTAKLAQLTDKYPLQVVPPSEIRSQKVDSADQARVGLGANLVLEGSLHQSGRLMRITYNLVDAGTRRQLRGDTVTAASDDPFAAEDRVVDSVLRQLDVELGAQDRHALEVHGTSQPAAYDFYLRGRGYLSDYHKPENVDSAIELFQRALERDPDYTLAFAGLGESYWHKYQFTHASEWMARALEACQKAAGLGEGAICLGDVYNGTGKYEQSVAEFQRALQLDPTSDDAYRGLAFAYEHLGKTAEAEQTYRHAIAVRPQYWAGYNWLGTFLFRQGRFEEANGAFLQVTSLAPDSFRGYQNLGAAYTAMGHFSQALPALQRSVGLRPSAAGYSNLATVFFYLRRFAEAARTYEKAVELDRGDYTLWGNLAEAYYWAPGEREKSAAAYRNADVLAERQLKVNPRETSALSQLALDRAMLGDREAAGKYLQRALALASGDPDLQLKAAVIQNHLGRRDEALTWLSKALASGLSADLIRLNPNFDDLKSEDRFQQLLRQKHDSS